MSMNPEVNPDIPALLGAAAAVALSGMPASSVFRRQHALVILMAITYLNPTNTQLENSQLDMVVAGTENAVLMVESEAKELPEVSDVGRSDVCASEKCKQPLKPSKKWLLKQARLNREWTPPAVNARN